jgi:hypothetical protein
VNLPKAELELQASTVLANRCSNAFLNNALRNPAGACPSVIDIHHLCAGTVIFEGSMSSQIKYMLVSLPTSSSQTNDKDEALSALQSTVASDNVTVLPFKIPEFKIGTLDALVQQADDLAKLESSCEAVVAKVGDSLRSLLEGDEEKISQQKTVNDSKSH